MLLRRLYPGPPFPDPRAYLVAIWLETLFYGINLCLFGSYVYVVRFRRARNISPVIFCVAVAMFAFSTVHVALGFARLIWGFIDNRDAPGGPAGFFADVSQSPNVAKVVIHTINTILGDGIVVWRCWHVWGRDWKICVVPVMLIIASAVCGFGQAHTFANAKTIHSAFATTLARWNGSLFTLSLVTNLLVTTLIAVRLWFITRDHTRNSLGASFHYVKVFMLIIESAMIYSAALLLEIILYFSNSNAFYIVYDPIAQLTSIVPITIIIIATLGLTVEEVTSADYGTRGGRTSSIQFNSRYSTGFTTGPGFTTGTGFTTSACSDTNVEGSPSVTSVLDKDKDEERRVGSLAVDSAGVAAEGVEARSTAVWR